jgi:hypothetical protein
LVLFVEVYLSSELGICIQIYTIQDVDDKKMKVIKYKRWKEEKTPY